MFKKLQQRYFAHVPFLVYTDDPVSKSFETLSRIKVSTVEQISRNLARIYDSKGSAGYSKRVPSPYGISTNACDVASIAIQYSSWREIKFAPKIEDNYPVGEKLDKFFSSPFNYSKSKEILLNYYSFIYSLFEDRGCS